MRRRMSTRLLVATLALAGIVLLAGCEEPRPPSPTSPSALPPTAQLAQLSFVDSNHGWVVARDCGGGTTAADTGACRALVYATDDGGQTWSPRARVLLTPRRIEFPDQSTGWLVGSIGEQCGRNACPNVVMRSLDGGRSWERASTTSAQLVDESFVTARDGWVLGEECATTASCRAILVTTGSGGESWANQELPLVGHDFRLERFGPSAGWVSGIVDGKDTLLLTRDGAKHWETVRVPCLGAGMSLDFRSSTEGWLNCPASGAGPTPGDTVYHTLDGGVTWQVVASLPVDQTSTPAGTGRGAVTFVSSTEGWILDSHGHLLATHDGGRTWDPTLAAAGPIAVVLFVDSSHGWVLGKQSVWRTRNAGQTWSKALINGDSGNASITMRVE